MLAAKKKQIEIHNKLLFPNLNKENGGSSSGIPSTIGSIMAQPKMKIADLSHNLMCYENGQPVIGMLNNAESVGSLRGAATEQLPPP